MIKLFKYLFGKEKERFLYYCTQPERARENGCNYFGACDNECLMPYEGCNLQKLKSKKYE